MKKIVMLAALLIVSNAGNCQVGKFCRKNICSWSCMVIAGAADGFAESLQFHYPSTSRKLNLNDQFFNPDLSWKNKYRGGDPANGERFPGSTTVFAWTTDAYHLARMTRNIAVAGAITFKIGHKQKWYMYLADFASYSVAYYIGFNATYEALK